MNGTKRKKPSFLTYEPDKSYYETPNPYVNAPSCNVNLLEMSRYAKKHGKSLVELTSEEVEMFAL